MRCSLDACKRGSYIAANGIFGKTGRTASEKVAVQMISAKCLPILLYGLHLSVKITGFCH